MSLKKIFVGDLMTIFVGDFISTLSGEIDKLRFFGGRPRLAPDPFVAGKTEGQFFGGRPRLAPDPFVAGTTEGQFFGGRPRLALNPFVTGSVKEFLAGELSKTRTGSEDKYSATLNALKY